MSKSLDPNADPDPQHWWQISTFMCQAECSASRFLSSTKRFNVSLNLLKKNQRVSKSVIFPHYSPFSGIQDYI